MPRHAAAFALLADALLALVGATAVPPLPTLHAARRAAETAVELDAENADGHGQLGQLLLVHQRDWAAAEPRMLESLRLAPGLASAHARYGWALMMNARYAEARACYAEARDLDPLSLLYRVHEALIAYYERDWPRAAAGFDAVLDVAPQHLFALALRAATALAAGDAADALERYRQLTALAPRLSIGRCGAAQAQALLGDRRAARRELTRLHALERDGFVSPYQVAMVLARLGDANGTLRALQQAADVADFNLVCAGVDPAFDALRGTPGFAALLARSGMAHLAAH